MECDVLVAGGGSAGIAAAVAAARLGARTVLIERHGALGGMASMALVHSICGLYRLPAGDGPPVLANDGFAAEFARRLSSNGGARLPQRMGRVEVVLHRPSAFASLADELVRAEPFLTVYLHSEIVNAGETVTFSCRGQMVNFTPQTCVDTTGDAALAMLRGAPCEMEPLRRLQRPAFIFALAGVAAGAVDDEARLRLAQRLARAATSGGLPSGALGAHFRASGQGGEVFVTIDLEGGPAFDPTSVVCLSRLEMEGRELAQQLTDFLRREIDGFSTAYIAAWPGRVGIRETRRIVGRYRLEGDDILAGAEFPDAIARAAWPMELRETAAGPRWRFPNDGRPCDIPLRALQARNDETLFAAGRCLSCSHEAQASIRVIGTCLATGEAAGLAAALKALQGECNAEGVVAARAQIAR